ncbi:hypothetical protein GCM10009127_06560 [Alteraurantiacibacter aestuarii]
MPKKAAIMARMTISTITGISRFASGDFLLSAANNAIVTQIGFNYKWTTTNPVTKPRGGSKLQQSGIIQAE